MHNSVILTIVNEMHNRGGKVMTNMNTSYLDLYDNPANLTAEELQWFMQICDDCRKATGIDIQIECADHYTMYTGKSKEALGTFHADNPSNPMTGDCKITIDNYFIHECYEELFNKKPNLNFEDLEHVIAHELAHIFQWRHCKRHRRLTEEIYQKIKLYQEGLE